METSANTIEYVRGLEKAGFSREQAEAGTIVLGNMVSESAATKMDVKLVQIAVENLSTEMGRLRKDMEAGDESLRKDMVAGDEVLQNKIDALRKDMVAGDEALQNKIDALRKEMQNGFSMVDVKFESLRTDMKAMENRILARLGTIVGAGIAALALLRFFG